jgi:hypothetical protein
MFVEGTGPNNKYTMYTFIIPNKWYITSNNHELVLIASWYFTGNKTQLNSSMCTLLAHQNF